MQRVLRIRFGDLIVGLNRARDFIRRLMRETTNKDYDDDVNSVVRWDRRQRKKKAFWTDFSSPFRLRWTEPVKRRRADLALREFRMFSLSLCRNLSLINLWGLASATSQTHWRRRTCVATQPLPNALLNTVTQLSQYSYTARRPSLNSFHCLEWDFQLESVKKRNNRFARCNSTRFLSLSRVRCFDIVEAINEPMGSQEVQGLFRDDSESSKQ